MALVRIVRIRLTTEHRGRGPAIAASARSTFPDIIGVESIEAGVNQDDPAEVVLMVRFEDGADVAAYRAHGTHVRFVAEHLRPYMDTLQAANYEVA